MTPQEIATKVVDLMYNNDPYSQWLGIERLKDYPGGSNLRLKVRQEMLNGFGIGHGGITYSLADSALAFASNSHGRKSVSVETSISHLKPIHADDVLTTKVEEVSLSNKIGVYHISVTNQKAEKVALFKGTVYRTSKTWLDGLTDI
jgi:acyl-CoA thioesterase